jgi:hypothetical protein
MNHPNGSPTCLALSSACEQGVGLAVPANTDAVSSTTSAASQDILAARAGQRTCLA